jgi:hypothetical protein
MPGFTGVQWSARTTERLSADIGRGAGTSPLVGAALSWREIADDAMAIGDELRRVNDRLRRSWEAPAASAALSDADALVSWMHQFSEFAALMERRLQGQSAATTVALLAMPNTGEIAATAALRDSMTAVGGALGGALLGGGAALDRVAEDQHQRAARAMQAYETASAEFAHLSAVPMPPPSVAADSPVGRSAGTSGATEPVGRSGADTVNPVVPVPASAPRSAYAATTPAASIVPAVTASPASPVPGPADPTIPIMPMASVPAVAAERLSAAPRLGAVPSDPLASPDAELAAWADSVAAPASWDEVDLADPSSGGLLRLPDPGERMIT